MASIQALRLCLDRVIPAYRPQAPEVDIDGDSLADQAAAAAGAIRRGAISADGGAKLIEVLAKASIVTSRDRRG